MKKFSPPLQWPIQTLKSTLNPGIGHWRGGEKIFTSPPVAYSNPEEHPQSGTRFAFVFIKYFSAVATHPATMLTHTNADLTPLTPARLPPCATSSHPLIL